jgi:cytochrome c oxidase cbb3-type subunit 3
MFSLFPKAEARAAILVAGVLAFAALSCAARADDPTRPTPEPGALSVATTQLFPGGGSPPPPDPRDPLYEGNPRAIADGARLFDWYNCSGCHFHGAGGMGPSLMDSQWRYGGSLDQIHATLVQGRPNGMPSWAGKIPDQQLWEISAYVRSLSVPSTAVGGPGQTMPQPPPPPAGAPAPEKSEAPGVQGPAP